MPTLVHIADERDTARILRSGLKISKWRNGIYCMPVTPEFYISHQWLRELKRRGIRTYVGVYFKMTSKELVWFGKYNTKHRRLELGKAIAQFMKTDDKLGFEFLIERKISPKEIIKIKHLPQKIGWRYWPGSNSHKLSCACPMCITPGEINSRKKRKKLEPPEKLLTLKEIIQELMVETNEIRISELFEFVRRKKRRTDPEVFRFIIEGGNISAIRALSNSLEYFRHPNAMKLLEELSNFGDETVRENCEEGMLNLRH